MPYGHWTTSFSWLPSGICHPCPSIAGEPSPVIIYKVIIWCPPIAVITWCTLPPWLSLFDAHPHLLSLLGVHFTPGCHYLVTTYCCHYLVYNTSMAVIIWCPSPLAVITWCTVHPWLTLFSAHPHLLSLLGVQYIHDCHYLVPTNCCHYMVYSTPVALIIYCTCTSMTDILAYIYIYIIWCIP
jgi:hypothetical protein